MYYFQEFPKTTYRVGSQSIDIVDITVRVKLLDYIKNSRNNLTIIDYEIENQKRPEEVSFELYETYDYTWTILILNDIYNVYSDWIKPQELIDKEIIREYGSIENANKTIVRYLDKDGYEIGPTSKNKHSVETAFEKIMRENEAKKMIKVFDPAVVFRVQSDLKEYITI